MYDTVVIEDLKLPAPSKDVRDWLKKNNAPVPKNYQTKDLENSLTNYTIDSKGQIFETHYKTTGKKKLYVSPFASWTDNRSFLEKAYFKIKNAKLHKTYPRERYVEETKPIRMKSNKTSTFEIYSYDEVGGRYVDVSYIITAVNGIVKKIKLNESKIESESNAKTRHRQNLEFKQKAAQEIARNSAFKAKWYYPVLKQTWNPFVFFSAKILQYICNKLISRSYHWHGV